MRGIAELPSSSWLASLGAEWPFGARDLLAHSEQIVRVSVVRMLGSAPREPGASLLVSQEHCMGTVGGGQLELQATVHARALLADASAQHICVLDYTLGPDLNQCCGGRVQLWLERLTRAQLPEIEVLCEKLTLAGAASLVTRWQAGTVRRDSGDLPVGVSPTLHCQADADGTLTLRESWRRERPPLWIFGAGHVGQAIVRLFLDLPVYQITWVDSRTGLLPTGLPAHIRANCTDRPVETVNAAPAGTRFLVLTHDHGLDYVLCRAVLERRDFQWLGLIGSGSKRARFRSRLSRDGFSADQIARLTCPIGVPGIRSKLPAAIAIGVVAQVLAQLDVVVAAQPTRAIGGCEQECGDCASSRRVAQ